MLPFAKVPLGPRAISTVCARSVASCLKSLSSGVICTILNQISGSVRLDRRLVDRDIRGANPLNHLAFPRVITVRNGCAQSVWIVHSGHFTARFPQSLSA